MNANLQIGRFGEGDATFVYMAIHYPKPETEALLLEAMHRLGAAVQNQPGLSYMNAHKDAQRGVIVAISIWETREAMLAAAPLMTGVTKGVPFDDWEAQPREIYQLTVV
jgi:Antibiotic biosynthesis monooxygenase